MNVSVGYLSATENTTKVLSEIMNATAIAHSSAGTPLQVELSQRIQTTTHAHINVSTLQTHTSVESNSFPDLSMFTHVIGDGKAAAFWVYVYMFVKGYVRVDMCVCVCVCRGIWGCVVGARGGVSECTAVHCCAEQYTHQWHHTGTHTHMQSLSLSLSLSLSHTHTHMHTYAYCSLVHGSRMDSVLRRMMLHLVPQRGWWRSTLECVAAVDSA